MGTGLSVPAGNKPICDRANPDEYERAYRNFESIASSCGTGVLTATTPLVPGYIDPEEIEKIAGFIADIDCDIPYSLLVFHPAFYMSDLPVTPIEQVKRCYEVATRYLKRVDIGNRHLLGL